MQLVGLTGGIASGKSSAARRMRECGVPVLDIDCIARGIVESDTAYLRVHCPESVLPDGLVDRKLLARKLFDDDQFRRELNSRVHPRVIVHVLLRILYHYVIGTQRLVLDVPLLFESGLHPWMSFTVVVYCTLDMEIQRLCFRDGISLSDAQRRIRAQLSLDAKARMADYVLDNDASMVDLYGQVDALLARTAPSILVHCVLYWTPVLATVVVLLIALHNCIVK